MTWKVEKNDDWLTSESNRSSYTLTVSGSGPMGNFVFTNSTQDVPWREYRDQISRIIVEEGVTAIGNDAFRGCGYYHKIREVRIPGTVARIGESAFSGSEFRDVDVIIPETVTDIGQFAFSATGLTSIQLPNGLKKISDYMLAGSKFTSIQIPASVTEIGIGAFSGCRQLTSVVIPDAVTTLGDGAFGSCEHLTDVTLSKNLTKIGTDTFSDCYALKQIDIPESVTALEGYHAFGECRSMEKVTIRNPKCQLYIYDKSSGKSSDFVDLGLPKTTVICGYDGSTAQTWAKHEGYEFESMGKAPSKPSKPANGWVKSGGKWYYYNENGVLQTGRFQVGGKWYFADDDGVMQTGWIDLGGGDYYYAKSSGKLVKGDWVKSGGKWYYMEEDYMMVHDGIHPVKGADYYFADSGVMKTGWIKVPGSEGDYYYAKSSGILQKKAWVKSGGKWYYMDENGLMVHDGLHDVEGSKYFFADNGAMKTGWIKVPGSDGDYYYAKSGGKLVKEAWVKSGGKWYYMNEDGLMARNTDRDGWHLDDNGVGTKLK